MFLKLFDAVSLVKVVKWFRPRYKPDIFGYCVRGRTETVNKPTT